MAVTFEMSDPLSAVDKIDFIGDADFEVVTNSLRGFGDSEFGFLPFRDSESQRASRSFLVNVKNTTIINLEASMVELKSFFDLARKRYMEDPDNALFLAVGSATTNPDREFRIIEGFVQEPRNVLFSPDIGTTFIVRNIPVTVVTEAFSKSVKTSTLSGTELENEVDSTLLNYVDDADPPTDGSAPMLCDVQVKESSGSTAWSSGTLWLWSRQGDAKHDDTTFFQNCDTTPVEVENPVATSPPTFTSGTTGGRTTQASGATSAFVKWEGLSGTTRTMKTSGWTIVAYFPESISAANLPKGKYKVLVRIDYETVGTTFNIGTAEVALGVGWSYGGQTKVPTAGSSTDAAIPGDDFTILNSTDWKTFSIGEIDIEPIPTPSGLTAPDLELRIYLAFFLASPAEDFNTSGETRSITISLDYIQLVDTEGNLVEVPSVTTGDEVRVISQGHKTGVFITNDSDVIQDFPEYNAGLPFVVDNEESIRWHWLKDDTSDPSNIQADIDVTYYPRSRGIF